MSIGGGCVECCSHSGKVIVKSRFRLGYDVVSLGESQF